MATISNLLTHWVGKSLASDKDRFNVLTECILKNKELLYSRCDIPFYSKYGGINPGKWAMKMICFTDLPLSEIEMHATKYSTFGIAFQKSYLVNNLVAPVWYSMNPYIYESYSYLYHHLLGVKSLIKDAVIPEGIHKGKKFDFDKLLEKFHYPFVYSQNYSHKEFIHDEKNTIPLPDMINFFEDETAFYYEREWRTVYFKGSKMKWNVDRDGKNYFKFDSEAVKYIIVPRIWTEPLRVKLLEAFRQNETPSIIAYEDLKFM